MKGTRKGKIKYNANYYSTAIPIICPYCNAFVEPHQNNILPIGYNNSTIYLVTFKVTCCSKLFFSTYERAKQDKEATLLYTYPVYRLDALPDSIHNISPRFVELYKQANYAEQMNFFELAGAGYRNAMEVLIKDYAINELEEPEDQVKKAKLYDAIGKYLPNIRLSSAADVVRVLGNDHTHYERKYEDIDFEILKQYLKIFVNAIETEYLINHPVVPTNR